MRPPKISCRFRKVIAYMSHRLQLWCSEWKHLGIFGGWSIKGFDILTSWKSGKYRKSYINFPRDLFISRTFERGWGGGGWLIQLTEYRSLHKELEHKVEKL